MCTPVKITTKAKIKYREIHTLSITRRAESRSLPRNRKFRQERAVITLKIMGMLLKFCTDTIYFITHLA